MAEPTSACASAASVEKPKNGLAGLKHWPYDLRSGFMVAMISLPFSMGIAITSGAPAVCGIMSAIIAGFVLPFLGGSYVTISGPAAGLARPFLPACWRWATAIWNKGYPLVLVAILLAGHSASRPRQAQGGPPQCFVPQRGHPRHVGGHRLAHHCQTNPALHGRTIRGPRILGDPGRGPRQGAQHGRPGLRTGHSLARRCCSSWPLCRFAFLKIMPPPVWVFLGGTLAAQLFLGIQGSKLINVPAAPLANGVVLPNISGHPARPESMASPGLDRCHSVAHRRHGVAGHHRRGRPHRPLAAQIRSGQHPVCHGGL